jgi:hypothetical protein
MPNPNFAAFFLFIKKKLAGQLWVLLLGVVTWWITWKLTPTP